MLLVDDLSCDTTGQLVVGRVRTVSSTSADNCGSTFTEWLTSAGFRIVFVTSCLVSSLPRLMCDASMDVIDMSMSS